MKNKLNKIIKIIFIFLIISTSLNYYIKADTLQQQYDQLNSQIQDIQNQKQQLQSQVNSNNYVISGLSSQLSGLYAQIQLYSKQINETQLQIQQIDVQVKILNNNIAQQQKDIQIAQNNISSLERTSNLRIEDSFENYRLYGDVDNTNALIDFSKINDFFKTSQYKELIQQDTNISLIKLARSKKDLEVKEDELASNLEKVKNDQKVITSKEVDLIKQNQEVSLKVNNYEAGLTSFQAQNNNTQGQINNLNSSQSQKQTQLQEVQREILSESTPHIGADQYVNAGTPIGIQGQTGAAFAIHLHFVVTENGIPHNPCNYLPGGVADDVFGLGGCGGGSRLKWPLGGHIYFTNNYNGYCYIYCPHLAIDIQSVPLDTVVYAAQSGYATKFIDSSQANVVRICEVKGCKVGLGTQYWHLRNFLF